MNRTPPLPDQNRFAPLCVEETEYTSSPPLPTTPGPDVPIPPSTRERKRGWERCLPSRYTISAVPGPNTLYLDVELESTDSALRLTSEALLDSGATGVFVDWNWAVENRIPLHTLSRAITVYNVDGSLNESGSIREIADMVLRVKDHSERVQFAVTKLGKQKVTLGMTWL